MTPESRVKQKFVKAAKQYGLTYINLLTTGSDGDPDKLALPQGGPAIFVEFKRPIGGELSEAQVLKHKLYRELGYYVFVVDCERDAEILAWGLAASGIGWPPIPESKLLSVYRKRFV